MITATTKQLAQIIWDYHQMNHELEKADCILALGSHDLRVAERAAQLYLIGLAPLLIMSGGLGNLTEGIWKEAEADQFARVAMQMGVPKSAIRVENQSSNTGENIRFTQHLLQNEGLDPQSFIVVQKPYMERRAYATFKQHWPEKDIRLASPQLSFEDYPNSKISMDQVIHIIVGDLQRIRIYPEKGFQIYQEIPTEVWSAFERLVDMGYVNHMVK